MAIDAEALRESIQSQRGYNPAVVRPIGFSSLLTCLTRERLVEVGRSLGNSLPSTAKNERQIEAFLESASPQLAAVVGLLQRDELKVICRQHGLPDGGRARFELARRVLVAAGVEDAGLAPTFADESGHRELPQAGDVVRVRHRQYLVETVTPPSRPRRPGGPLVAHRVRLVGLDDDSHSRTLGELSALDSRRCSAPNSPPWGGKASPTPRPGFSRLPSAPASAAANSPTAWQLNALALRLFVSATLVGGQALPNR